MISKFEFKLLINGIENLPKELLTYNSVLYRIFDKNRNKNYIGTAKYGMPARLYDGFNGHVSLLKSDNKFKCRGMYHNMKLNIEDFELYIEDIASPENYNYILQKETEYIKKYDSVLFGYNVSPDGKPGWKTGTICVNDGTFDLYIYQCDVNRFIQNGFVIGSCKHDFLKGTVWVHNNIESKMINKNQLDQFINNGYKLGSNKSPNKGKIWANNGKRSKLISRDLLGTKEFKDFKFLGRRPQEKKTRKI